MLQLAGIAKSILAPHFIHQRLELVNILKAAVDAGKTHVGDLVELFELAHDQLAEAGRRYLAQAEVEKFFLDALDGRVHLLGADRALAQREVHGVEDLAALVFDAAAVLFDDGRKVDVGPLVGGEALFTRAALAAAAYEVCVFRHPRFHDLGFKVAAERAFHPASPGFASIIGLQPARGMRKKLSKA